jgi:hypothetical protein
MGCQHEVRCGRDRSLYSGCLINYAMGGTFTINHDQINHLAPGAAGTLEDRYCILDGAGSSVSF